MTTHNATPATSSCRVYREKIVPETIPFSGWVGQENEAISVFNIARQEGYKLTPLASTHKTAEFHGLQTFSKSHEYPCAQAFVMLQHVSGIAWIFGLKPCCSKDPRMNAYLHMYSPKTCNYFDEATDAQSVAWDKRVQRLRAKGVPC